jgi:hypothetical protein
MDSVESLEWLCRDACTKGAPKNQIAALILALNPAFQKDAKATKDKVGGPIYELVTAINLTLKGVSIGNYQLKDPKGTGDAYYTKSGVDRVRQLKWAAGSGKTVLRDNLSSALSQLAGTTPLNPEYAPANSIAIADVVLTNPPQDVRDTFSSEEKMSKYLKEMVENAHKPGPGKKEKEKVTKPGETAKEKVIEEPKESRLGKTSKVSVRITMITGDNGKNITYCVDFTSGVATVRAAKTKSCNKIVVAEALTELFAKDVETHGKDQVKQAVLKLSQGVASW